MSQATTTVPAWLSLVGLAFAALAAGASWASVRLNRRQWLLSQQPFLRLQLLVEPSGDHVLKILNAGPGSARGVRFCLAAGEEYVAGYAGPQFGGFLDAGDKAEVVLDLQATRNDPLQAVAVCWDSVERIHRFSAHDDHFVRRGPRRSPLTASDPEKAFLEIYGQNALENLRQVSGHGRTSE
jgi:hypothetical protein